ncbi:HNH endonuclease [Pseudoalteromonas sp. 20-92]|uniref:HNH endonuclease n=1 Tax=Pseudoalteromonas issachenkonii TaxID=152297 RepID=A0ABU9H5E1_9GAMM|nr:HNH endonuclease [Pseudoalteromonas sp. 20-92]MDQ2045666.1 HNH endonuclease [Pseudoalteromonas sp. 20-92]
MRPVKKGATPVAAFNRYEDAFDYLLERVGIGEWNGIKIGQYCSYCERCIQTNLAVEHIEPKNGDFGKPELQKEWSNFLLACVNCNSTKGSKEVDLKSIFLPDRDNTFRAIQYKQDGTIEPKDGLNEHDKQMAINTINLLGLNNSINSDLSGVAKDRRVQRLNVWMIALNAYEDFRNCVDKEALQRTIVREMLSNGFFSIWMKVFEQEINIKKLFIESVRGTKNSGCFDEFGASNSQHPNDDNLESGGKI